MRSRNIVMLVGGAALVLSLSACSVTETVKNFLSSTSGRAWWTEDGLIKTDQRVNAFMEFNFENIKQDMARGHGEYLDSLTTLMAIPPERRAAFHAHAQSRYPLVIERHSSPEDTLVLLAERPQHATTWR